LAVVVVAHLMTLLMVKAVALAVAVVTSHPVLVALQLLELLAVERIMEMQVALALLVIMPLEAVAVLTQSVEMQAEIPQELAALVKHLVFQVLL
jgi:hypothetical protein